MKDILIKKGILSPSGKIQKDKINLVSGAIVKPFAEMIWVTTDGDMDAINRLTHLFLQMNTPKERDRLFQRPLRKFCVSVIRQNQEYHIFKVHGAGLFPLSTVLPTGWGGMRAGTA